MNHTPCFIFYGERASGKTWLSKKLYEGNKIEVIDEFPHFMPKENLIEKISYETQNDKAPDMYIIISYLDEATLTDIALEIKRLPGLLVTMCNFKSIRDY